MGHRPALPFAPEKIPGLKVNLPSGVQIDTTSLYPGNHRTQLEEFLAIVEADQEKEK